MTTNLGFADWTQMFGEATLTAALLDRLTHQAHIINCTWESYRLQETLCQSARATSPLVSQPVNEVAYAPGEDSLGGDDARPTQGEPSASERP